MTFLETCYRLWCDEVYLWQKRFNVTEKHWIREIKHKKNHKYFVMMWLSMWYADRIGHNLIVSLYFDVCLSLKKDAEQCWHDIAQLLSAITRTMSDEYIWALWRHSYFWCLFGDKPQILVRLICSIKSVLRFNNKIIRMSSLNYRLCFSELMQVDYL